MNKFNKYTKALIVVDMVNGFVNEGVLHDKNIKNILPKQIILIKQAIASSDTITIFLRDTHEKNSTELKRFGKIPHCIKDTSESQLVDELKIYEGVKNTVSIEKNSTSFMEAPDFRKMIKKLKNLKEAIVVGCCTDICIANGTIGLANYLDQNNKDVDLYVYEDCIETYNSIEHPKDIYSKCAKVLMKQQGINFKKIGGE